MARTAMAQPRSFTVISPSLRNRLLPSSHATFLLLICLRLYLSLKPVSAIEVNRIVSAFVRGAIYLFSYNTIHYTYNTIQNNTIQYNTIQYNAIQYNNVYNVHIVEFECIPVLAVRVRYLE